MGLLRYLVLEDLVPKLVMVLMSCFLGRLVGLLRDNISVHPCLYYGLVCVSARACDSWVPADHRRTLDTVSFFSSVGSCVNSSDHFLSFCGLASLKALYIS